MPYISLFPLSERLSELWSLCSSGGLQASSAAVVFCRDCVAVSPTHQIQTHRRTNTQIHARVLSPFLPVFVCLVLNRTHASGIRPSTSSPLLYPGAHLSLFPRSLFPRQFSTSSLSSLASSCVIQLKNIRSSRPAINIPCPPKTVRIIIFLIITVVFL